jgi:hypothetical protein
MCAQFVAIPSLSRVSELFQLCTGTSFIVEALWRTWLPVKPEALLWLSEYIRPSHQKLLRETIAGEQKNPCSLLRQLLRPHDYRIEKTSSGWVLKFGKQTQSPTLVGVKEGKMITWDE